MKFALIPQQRRKNDVTSAVPQDQILSRTLTLALAYFLDYA